MFAADDFCSLAGTFQGAAIDGIKIEVSKIAGVVLCLPDTLVESGKMPAPAAVRMLRRDSLPQPQCSKLMGLILSLAFLMR